MIELQDIRPNVEPPHSDKFSRMIYNWVRRNRKKYGIQIFCLQRSTVDGSFRPWDCGTAARADIYIGSNDGQYVIGANLASIRTFSGKATAVPVTPHTIEITQWFWSEYVKRGRCVFDPTHEGFMTNIEGRYDTLGKCLWCGDEQPHPPEPPPRPPRFRKEDLLINKLFQDGYSVMVVAPFAKRFSEKYRAIPRNDIDRNLVLRVDDHGEVAPAHG